jgi:hypothetical protein
MSKFKTMIRKDIELCDEYIKADFAKYSEVNALTGKYLIDYPDFNSGIIGYASVPGYETNEIENIKIVKGKLEYLLNRVDNPDLYNKQKSSGISISTVNNNTNLNSITFNMSHEDIENNINDNTYLSNTEKAELLEKLGEIIELQKSNETKAKRWDKAKKILTFLLDKGADIAIMYIPQILLAIK